MERTIAVTGIGKVSTAPDEANLAIGIRASAPTARAVSALANGAMGDLVAAIKANGIADRDIQTGYFSIQPNYEMVKNVQRQVGHTANNTVNVTIRSIPTVSTIIDAVIAVSGESITINNLRFLASDATQGQAKATARTAALRDAQQQAEAIAQTLGVTVGPVQAVDATTQQFTPRPPGMLRAMAVSTGGGSTPIEAGELDIVTTVSVIFAIA